MATKVRGERRRASRKASDPSIVRVETKDGMGRSKWITADLIDSSETGIGISLVTPLEAGATVPVRGTFGANRPNVTLKMGVKWCDEKSDGTFHAGLEFLEAD